MNCPTVVTPSKISRVVQCVSDGGGFGTERGIYVAIVSVVLPAASFPRALPRSCFRLEFPLVEPIADFNHRPLSHVRRSKKGDQEVLPGRLA